MDHEREEALATLRRLDYDPVWAHRMREALKLRPVARLLRPELIPQRDHAINIRAERDQWNEALEKLTGLVCEWSGAEFDPRMDQVTVSMALFSDRILYAHISMEMLKKSRVLCAKRIAVDIRLMYASDYCLVQNQAP